MYEAERFDVGTPLESKSTRKGRVTGRGVLVTRNLQVVSLGVVLVAQAQMSTFLPWAWACNIITEVDPMRFPREKV